MKVFDCDRCLLSAHSPYLVCAVHPYGVNTDICHDFRPDPKATEPESWAPEGYSWYGEHLVANRPSRYTPEQQLEILETHPLFTGVCPECGYKFDESNPPLVHWDCPQCGWVDDSV